MMQCDSRNLYQKPNTYNVLPITNSVTHFDEKLPDKAEEQQQQQQQLDSNEWKSSLKYVTAA